MNETTEQALRKVNNMKWSQFNTVHDELDHALFAVNLGTGNGGLYQYRTTRVKGVEGLFLVNKDDSINYSERIIKRDDGKFVVEYMTNQGLDIFESEYKRIETGKYCATIKAEIDKVKAQIHEFRKTYDISAPACIFEYNYSPKPGLNLGFTFMAGGKIGKSYYKTDGQGFMVLEIVD